MKAYEKDSTSGTAYSSSAFESASKAAETMSPLAINRVVVESTAEEKQDPYDRSWKAPYNTNKQAPPKIKLTTSEAYQQYNPGRLKLTPRKDVPKGTEQRAASSSSQREAFDEKHPPLPSLKDAANKAVFRQWQPKLHPRT